MLYIVYKRLTVKFRPYYYDLKQEDLIYFLTIWIDKIFIFIECSSSLYLFKILVFLSKNQYKSIPLFLQGKVSDNSDSMLHQERQELLENQPMS